MLDIKRAFHVVEPGCDGVFRHAESLILHQLESGLKVALAYSSVRGSSRLQALALIVARSSGPVRDLRVGNSPTPFDLIAFSRVLSCIRCFRPEVIHCHSSKAGILGRAAAALTGVPAVYTPNAYYGMGKQAGARTALFNGLERLFGGLGHTVNVSEDEAAFARERLRVKPTRQSVIPNAVDTEVFRPASRQEMCAWRSKHGIPPNAVVIGTLGRFSYQKDPLTLYRAFELLARQRPNVYLAHIGTGELARDCEEWIGQSGLSSRVLRIEYSPEPSEFYRAIDAFVLSSRYEGLSIAVLEALATNLPLVLTDVPGNRDFFKLGLSHLWTAPAENPAALAQAIAECTDSLVNGALCNHRKIAVERFSEEACFGRILELYQQVGRKREN
jgi:glycosyltransferase involved in cell wall biosynthesis